MRRGGRSVTAVDFTDSSHGWQRALVSVSSIVVGGRGNRGTGRNTYSCPVTTMVQ